MGKCLSIINLLVPSFRQEFEKFNSFSFLWIVLSKLFVLACISSIDNGMPYKAKAVILQCCHSQCKDSECVVSL